MINTYSLENDFAKASFNSKGAELCSFINKANNKEYIWQADPAFWPRHAPILFPIVGRLKNDTYSYEGKNFELSQHGFARDLEFEKGDAREDEVKFSLQWDTKTLQHYPFKFKLIIGYKLENETLTVSYEVLNEDDKTILFSIGAHPAFNCPLLETEKFEDYVLEFEKVEKLERYLVTGGLFDGEKEEIKLTQHELGLDYRLFQKDALVFKYPELDQVILRSTKSKHGVRMNFPSFPYLGIWTKAPGAPFLCIEPWFGLADSVESDGVLLHKEGVIALEQGKKFETAYTIEIF